VAPSAESLPVIVTVPVVPWIVPVLPLVMLMIAELLDVNVVDPVTSLPFKDAANCTVDPAVLLVRLIGLVGFEVIVRLVEVPAVTVMLPETTVPFVDCAAACTVTAVPGVVTLVAVTRPAELTVAKPGGVTLQVAFPEKSLWLPSSYVPVAINCTVFPVAVNVVDCKLVTDIPVSVGSTKNPWQPTPMAISTRTPKDATICTLRRLLDIKEKPSSVTPRAGQFRVA